MQVTLLAVGLIVGFAIGLGAGWFFWHGRSPEEEQPERPERRPARYPRSYEPSTPPQHRPTPRPRPVTALHHPNPIPAEVVDPGRSTPSPPTPVVPEVAAAAAPPAAPDPEPFHKYEYRPAPQPERPVSIDKAQAPDRQLLNDLLESNRRLTEDAEQRLRREGAAPARQLDLTERPPATRQPASAPAQNDLLARHRKLEEDSRRMSRRGE